MCDPAISRARLVLQSLCHHLLCGCVGRCVCVAEFQLGSFHMIAHTHVTYVLQNAGVRGRHLLCGCVGRYICVAEFYLIAHTHVCFRRQEFVVAASFCGACVMFCLRVRQYMRGTKQAISRCHGSCDGVRRHGLFRSVRVVHMSVPEARARCQHFWCGVCVCVCVCVCVFTRTHMCVAEKPRVRRHASACGDILIEHAHAATSVLHKVQFRAGS